jgi:NAD(P)-dependent dehydrogenase (short-subunit alcohol dehydrogenase family)
VVTSWDESVLQTSGKAVVITGASSGIGEACALQLDQLGFQVFAGVRKLEDGAALQKKSSSQLVPVLLDVTQEETLHQAAQAISSRVGEAGLAGLINNAGVVIGGPLEFIPLDKLREQLEINVIGQIAVTQAFMPLIRKGTGRIVNIGSIAGRSALPLMGPYSASKYAMEALTDSLRMELASAGIHVAIVAPGSVATPIWQKSWDEAQGIRERLPEQAASYYQTLVSKIQEASKQSSRRGVPPSHVVRAVLHALTAARPKTRYLVGRDAYLRAIVRHLPDRLLDWLIFAKIGYKA